MQPFKSYLLFFCIIITLLSCSSTRYDAVNTKSKSGSINIADFEITEASALKMIDYYNACKNGCDSGTVVDSSEVLDQLKNTYSACTIDMQNARYKDNKDKKFYKKRITPHHKSKYYKVKGYATHIYIVSCTNTEQKSKGGDSPTSTTKQYYNLSRLCPPPIGCNGAPQHPLP